MAFSSIVKPIPFHCKVLVVSLFAAACQMFASVEGVMVFGVCAKIVHRNILSYLLTGILVAKARICKIYFM